MCDIFNKSLMKSKIKSTYDCLVRKIKKNWLVLILVIALIVVVIFFHDAQTISAPIAILGLIFAALKQKLDQASYHKSLFDERLKVFNAINEALVRCYQDKDWREINQKLTPVFNKSYFLFSHKTYAFIRELSEQLITKTLESRSGGSSSITKGEIEKANTFLNNLLSERELAKKFPELKIDEY